MNILIDIGHMAQLNFLKSAIHELKYEHKVYVSYLNRGGLPAVIHRELNDVFVISIGKHKGNLLSILIDANLIRLIKFIFFIIRNHIDIGVNGGVPLGFALRFLRKKHIQFDDDIERKVTIFLESISSDKLIIFPYTGKNDFHRPNNIKFIPCLKEWAYLSPTYFRPDKSVLIKYDVKPKQYVFLREVSTKTINYMNQEGGTISNYISVIACIGLKVILSLEDKLTMNAYPKEWIILQEPVEDIHSLIYYSSLLVSSGDSMAREGAMLGVKSIYCGIRDMAANRFIQNYGMFHRIHSIKDFQAIIEKDIVLEQESYRTNLDNIWIDVNRLIVDTINDYNI